MKNNRQRIDVVLVEKGFFASRAKAQASIMAGLIFVDGEKIEKPGTGIEIDAKIEVKGEPHPYVSRGGVKLEAALKTFNIDVKNRVALDIGASTGGFTDRLLQGGAKKVYAIDVGYGQLAWKLQTDKRVKFFDRMNARSVKPEDIYEPGSEKASIAVIDVSFISIAKILPAVHGLLKDQGEVVALVKPQFEAGREKVESGGLIRKSSAHKKVLEKVIQDAQACKFGVINITYSPISGADGNLEFFIHLKKDDASAPSIEKKIGEVVEQAHLLRSKCKTHASLPRETVMETDMKKVTDTDTGTGTDTKTE